MERLRNSRIISTFMMLFMLSCLIFAFTGCIVDDLREKFDLKNGHWHYDENGNIDGCLAGGTDCVYVGANNNPQ